MIGAPFWIPDRFSRTSTVPPGCGKMPDSETTPLQGVEPLALAVEQTISRTPCGTPCAFTTGIRSVVWSPACKPASVSCTLKLPVPVVWTQFDAFGGTHPPGCSDPEANRVLPGPLALLLGVRLAWQVALTPHPVGVPVGVAVAVAVAIAVPVGVAVVVPVGVGVAVPVGVAVAVVVGVFVPGGVVVSAAVAPDVGVTVAFAEGVDVAVAVAVAVLVAVGVLVPVAVAVGVVVRVGVGLGGLTMVLALWVFGVFGSNSLAVTLAVFTIVVPAAAGSGWTTMVTWTLPAMASVLSVQVIVPLVPTGGGVQLIPGALID
jgi:hypothetical protein